jgi:purine-binding chemotaxis protein CheW
MNMQIKQSGSHLEIVSFHLGDQEFCIDIMAIREIRGWAPVTPMPHTCAAPSFRSSTWPAGWA